MKVAEKYNDEITGYVIVSVKILEEARKNRK
jgi:hypothetical protein